MNAYLKMLRINEWRGNTYRLLMGLLMAEAWTQPLWKSLMFFVMFTFYLGAGFVINDFSDIKEDAIHKKKKNQIALGKASKKSAATVAVLLALTGVALSATLGLNVFLLFGGITALGFAYSLRPIRLKSRPFLDLIASGLFLGAPTYILPFLAFGTPLTTKDWILAVIFFLVSILAELTQHIRDYESDLKAGLRTTVCVIGKKASEKLRLAVVIITQLLGLLLIIHIPVYIVVYVVATVAMMWNLKKTINHKLFELYYLALLVLLATQKFLGIW